MFFFHWFDVFDSEYRNGFADGVSIVLLIRAAVAVYAWKRKCARFRGGFLSFLKKMGDNAATPYEIDDFANKLGLDWCLAESVKRKILGLLPPIREFAVQSFQSRVPAWENAVAELEEMARRGEFDAFTLFRKMPVRAACLSFIHAGWFGMD